MTETDIEVMGFLAFFKFHVFHLVVPIISGASMMKGPFALLVMIRICI